MAGFKAEQITDREITAKPRRKTEAVGRSQEALRDSSGCCTEHQEVAEVFMLNPKKS